MGAPAAELAAAAREFAATNDARLANRPVPGPEAVGTTESIEQAELRGYRLENVTAPQEPTTSAAEPAPEPLRRNWAALGLAAAVLAVLMLWRWRRRSG
jgi:hypothetical protein